MTLTVFDGIFLGVILAGVIWGSWKGLTWELAMVATLVLGYLVAYPSAGKLAPFLDAVDARQATMTQAIARLGQYLQRIDGMYGVTADLRALATIHDATPLAALKPVSLNQAIDSLLDTAFAAPGA